MTTNDSNNHESRLTVLLTMHDFYGQEARHHREMMWETVKWGSVIFALLIGLCVNKFSDLLKDNNYIDATIILVLFTIIVLISSACKSLMKRFYETSLMYISMFAKIEDELDFDFRENRRYFCGDDFITHEQWRIERQGKQEPSKLDRFIRIFTKKKEPTFSTSKRYVNKIINKPTKTLYTRFAKSFNTFIGLSLIGSVFVYLIIRY